MADSDSRFVEQPGKTLKPVAVYLLVMLVLVASAATVAVQTYRHNKDAAASRSNARADLAAEFVATAFMSSRSGLQTVAGFVEPMVAQAGVLPDTGLESLERLLDEKRQQLNYVDALFITDTSGNLLYDSEESGAQKLASWDFLRAQLASSDRDGVITPLHPNPKTGQLAIWNARPLRSPSEELAGYLVARHTPAMLADSLARLSMSEGQSIAILDTTMTLVGRLPADGDLVHTGIRVKEPHTRDFIDSGQDSAQAITASPVDGTQRLYTFQRVKDTPYLVIVGEEVAVIVRDWWQNLWISVVAFVVVAVVGWLSVRQFQRRAKAEQALLAENHERLELQRSAQASEARLRALIRSIPDLIFVFDEQGRFVFVHASDEDQLIKPAEDMLGEHYRDLLPPELSGRLASVTEQVGVTGQPADLEYQLVFDGEVREFSAKITVLTDKENRNTGFLAVVRDVTQSKIQEAELRIASTAFETHLGIIITDDQGLILRANRAFTRITGYEEHEVVGKTPAVLQSGLQDRSFYQNFWARVKELGSWEGEIWNRKKNGEVYAEWLTVTAIRSESGAILNYVGTFHDITKRKEAEREAHRLAFYDSLTGLANRVLLEDRITEVARSNARSGGFAALLEVELDHFRAVNDSRGYDVGDQVLKSVAERISGLVRSNDTLARIGGDEFGLLLLELGESEQAAARTAERMAEKIQTALQQPFEMAGSVVRLASSIGIVLIGNRQIPGDEQLQRAEQATQQAKQQARQNGGRPIAFFDPEIQARAVENILLEDELRSALDAEQFQLYFQPQISHPDKVQGYEVLLRWQHPDKGMVSPGVFIPLAEQSRLIIPIGEWVLQQACEQLARWQANPDRKDLYLAVNVSVYQFQHAGFPDQVARILDETGAPPHLLELEVTESLLMDDPDRVTEIMNRLRDLGIRFSLDDFGTGYSSLSYLKRLPLDQIKIDQSFTRDLGENSTSGAIVDSIIGLSNGLKLQVIAEGVETEEQRDWLVEHGCRHFQGYLFARPGPLPADS
ncbi:PAS domain S-box-containing protein/diguanylate cyclase (GGDEF) domain-containing protein [Marinobacter persicus]|uniref:cyclic-guanylate-specific phosphodiesterase n=1 Tax=Marinobacter persicus TaxID=930118 RepID=A0A1I3SXD0_9GAMM|nr:EAL domain-containing protein [Marinobacter persicus]GHD40816.1 hypothetical protein GCM10008110_02110 [Marinobacter persicus]SFJ63043.1 PAS domain S-box-containing protein/diguanylate cyclase (GGDEF) domain-containing protein [Marinobacter persicus]